MIQEMFILSDISTIQYMVSRYQCLHSMEDKDEDKMF